MPWFCDCIESLDRAFFTLWGPISVFKAPGVRVPSVGIDIVEGAIDPVSEPLSPWRLERGNNLERSNLDGFLRDTLSSEVSCSVT
jgi:hypothetical protein